MTRAARVACAVGLLAALSVSACTASSRPSDQSTAPAASNASTASTPSPPDTSAPPITTSPSTPEPASSSSPSASPSAPVPSTSVSTSPSTSTSPVPASSTCTKLTIRVLLGSGAPGYEFAALQFVNDGASTCTLVGVPTVSLSVKGRQAGTQSQPSNDRARFRQYRLAPGAVAESKLKDFSSCNAPLSATIRVTAPGTDISTTRPGRLRACKLVVYPLGAPE